MNVYIFHGYELEGREGAQAVADFFQQEGMPYVLLDTASPEGGSLAELYDVVRYPAVVIASDGGTYLQGWQGQLPTAQDMIYYARI